MSARCPRRPSARVKRGVVLLSGGLDSSTLLHYVCRRLGSASVYAVSFLYGQKHSRELTMARWQARAAGVAEHRIIDLSFLKDVIRGASALTDEAIPIPALSAIPRSRRSQPPTYVPNRNMILLAVAAAYAEARGVTDVFYGAQAQDEYGYWDCTPGFLSRMNRTLSLNRSKPVRVHAPFIRMRKSEELQVGLDLGVDYAHTWTCYRGGRQPCGTCPTCVERATAFREVGMRDPLLTTASAGSRTGLRH